MRKILFLLLCVFSAPSLAQQGNEISLVGDWPYAFWSDWYNTFNNQKCPTGQFAVGFSAHRDGHIFVFEWNNFRCVTEGEANLSGPWVGDNPNPQSPLPAPPNPLPAVSMYEYEVDLSNVVGSDSPLHGSYAAGTMAVRDDSLPVWSNPTSNFLNSADDFNAYMRTNIRRYSEYVASSVGLSHNLTARRIAQLQNDMAEQNQLNWLYHQNTVQRLDGQSAAAANYVVDEVSDHINTQNQFMAGEFIALGDAISDISIDNELMNISWQLSDVQYMMGDVVSDVSSIIPTLGMQIGMFQGSLSSDLSSQFSNVNSNIQNVNSRVGELPSLIGARHGEVMGRIGQLEGGIMSAHGEVMSALAGIDGSGGGGLSSEEAAGLIGEYSGDDYVDGDAEGILGTEGLSLDDLEGDTIMLDSVAVDYFNFAPVSCYEPISINISVFGMDNTIEIDLTPLCSVFNIVGVLLFIASNLMAVRIVVGAF